jgi:hypothetical protein
LGAHAIEGPAHHLGACRWRAQLRTQQLLDQIEARVPVRALREARYKAAGLGHERLELHHASSQLVHRHAKQEPRADGGELDLQSALFARELGERELIVDAGHKGPGRALRTLGLPRVVHADGRSELEDDHGLRRR